MSTNTAGRRTVSGRVGSPTTMRIFTASGDNQDLSIEGSGGELSLRRYPVQVEFQDVGDYGLAFIDGHELTYDNLTEGNRVVMQPTTLLATDDSTNPTASGAVLVCWYN